MDILDENNFESEFVTVLHEMTHIYGLASSAFHLMYNRETKTLRKPTEYLKTDREGPFPIQATSPKALNWARNHFECPTLQGIPLENSGSKGSAGSHWDQFVLGNELMNPQANFNTVNSGLNYEFLEDTGHFQVVRSFYEYLAWGDGVGCGIFSGKCEDNPYTCDPKKTHYLCSPDYYSVGICISKGFSEKCYTFHETAYSDCRIASNSEHFTHYGVEIMSFGPGRRCLNGYLHRDQKGSEGNCLKTTCNENRDEVTFLIGNAKEVTCRVEDAGKQLRVYPEASAAPKKDFFYTCPDPRKICEEDLYCKNDCSGNGRCLKTGACWCYVGFTGDDCSIKNVNNKFHYKRFSECPEEGQYILGGRCCSTECTSGCLKDDPDQCICPKDRILVDGLCCHSKCPGGCLRENPEICSGCQQGFTKLNGKCCSAACQFDCEAQNPQNCVCPDPGSELKNGVCCSKMCPYGCSKANPDLCECPRGEIFLRGNCCSEECKREFGCLSSEKSKECLCGAGQKYINGNCCSEGCLGGCSPVDPSECTCGPGEESRVGKCCSEQCKDCKAENSNHCESCFGGFSLLEGTCCRFDSRPLNGKCCLKEEYLDPKTGECMGCDLFSKHFYVRGGLYCEVCPLSCKYCDGLGKCLICADGLVFNSDGVCVAKGEGGGGSAQGARCELGSYPHGDSGCKKCHESCGACDGPRSTDCLSCSSKYDLDKYEVILGECRCKSGTYASPDGSGCVPCDGSCSQCVGGGEDECVLCKDEKSIVYNEDKTKNSGKCYQCGLGENKDLKECQGKVFELKEKEMTNKERLKLRMTINPKSTASIPIRRQSSAVLKINLPDIILTKIFQLSSRFITKDCFEVALNPTPETTYTVKGALSADLSTFDFHLSFEEASEELIEVSIKAKQPNYFLLNKPPWRPPAKTSEPIEDKKDEEKSKEGQNGDKGGTRILQAFGRGVSDHLKDMMLISNKPFIKKIRAFQKPSLEKEERARNLGVGLRSLIVFIIFIATLVSLFFSPSPKSKVIAGYFRLATSSWVLTKLSMLDIPKGHYLTIFMDELFRLEMLPIRGLADETAAKKSMGGRLDEYLVPVALINSSLIMVSIYLAGSIMLKVLSCYNLSGFENDRKRENDKKLNQERKKKGKKVSLGVKIFWRTLKGVGFVCISFSMINAFFYSLIDVIFMNGSGGGEGEEGSPLLRLSKILAILVIVDMVYQIACLIVFPSMLLKTEKKVEKSKKERPKSAQNQPKNEKNSCCPNFKLSALAESGMYQNLATLEMKPKKVSACLLLVLLNIIPIFRNLAISASIVYLQSLPASLSVEACVVFSILSFAYSILVPVYSTTYQTLWSLFCRILAEFFFAVALCLILVVVNTPKIKDPNSGAFASVQLAAMWSLIFYVLLEMVSFMMVILGDLFLSKDETVVENGDRVIVVDTERDLRLENPNVGRLFKRTENLEKEKKRSNRKDGGGRRDGGFGRVEVLENGEKVAEGSGLSLRRGGNEGSEKRL